LLTARRTSWRHADWKRPRRSRSPDRIPLRRQAEQQLGPTEDGFETAHRELDAAVAGLRRAGTTHHIPRALLTRARLFGSERGSGKGKRYPWESPAADLAAAREMIEQCGYWRRKEELEAAEKVIGV
jgi:hypothetical protein